MDHPPNGDEDLANAACGALHLALRKDENRVPDVSLPDLWQPGFFSPAAPNLAPMFSEPWYD